MKIHLVFLGSLQYDFGQMNLTDTFNEGSTIITIVKELIKKPNFESLKNFFTPTFDSTRALIIFINDQDISVLQGMSSSLKPDDKITFVPVIHGG
jgi:molybdopterin converting factor small subunit